jgi:hypothetical protein
VEVEVEVASTGLESWMLVEGGGTHPDKDGENHHTQSNGLRVRTV